MHFRNSSQYPTDRLKELLKVAAGSIDLGNVAVNIKSSPRHRGSGRAYSQLPYQSPLVHHKKRMRYLITAKLGAPQYFPCNNLHVNYRWVRVKEGEAYDPNHVRGVMKMVNGVEARGLEHCVKIVGPYGGRMSPVMVYNTWEEWAVALLAHELMHIQQFRHRSPCSESECERYAASRLEAFRESLRVDPLPASVGDCII